MNALGEESDALSMSIPLFEFQFSEYWYMKELEFSWVSGTNTTCWAKFPRLSGIDNRHSTAHAENEADVDKTVGLRYNSN